MSRKQRAWRRVEWAGERISSPHEVSEMFTRSVAHVIEAWGAWRGEGVSNLTGLNWRLCQLPPNGSDHDERIISLRA